MFNSAIIASTSPKLKPNTGFKYFCAGLFLVSLLVLRLGSSQTANLSYGVLAGYALFGRRQVIQALTISWLFTLINPGLAPEGSVGSFGRYLVIATAAISMLLRGKITTDYKIGKLQAYTGALGAVLILHSMAFSPIVDVSVLKAISWTVVLITLMSAWKGLTLKDRETLGRQIELGLVGIMIISLPLLLFPSIGYLRNGTGFQGVLNHPQAFGPTVALAGVIFGSRILASSTHRWRDIFIVFLSILLIVLSEARTAGFAFVFGILSAAVIIQVLLTQRREKILVGLRSYKLRFVIAVASVVALIAAPMLHETLSKYLFKRSDTSSILAAADASRGQLIDKMISNISENPLSGIGFGISSDMGAMTVERDPVFNLPLSAVIEKGVLPLAVMEELGCFGAVAVFVWLAYLVVRCARSGVEKLAVLLTILLANMGESMLFSVGGMGMIFLILLAQAVTNTSQGKSQRA